MPSIKADYINQIKKDQIIYSDIPNNFDMSPNSGDLALITNNDSVTQSLENLVLTFIGERLYQPNIGSSVQFRAFELANEIQTELIKSAIINCAIDNEPRANILDVRIQFINDNAYAVAIYFRVINNNQVQTLNVIFNRTR